MRASRQPGQESIPIPIPIAASSCTCTCTASLCTCTFLGRARARPKRQPLSQPDLPIPIRRASRRGRGGIFDQPIGVGRSHALKPTFWGLFSVIPIQLTKAVVENGSDVSPFSPLPLPLCAPCDLCGSPSHLDSESRARSRWPFRTGFDNDLSPLSTHLPLDGTPLSEIPVPPVDIHPLGCKVYLS